MATIVGDNNNNTLTGTDCDDTIDGKGGDDIIRGLGGNDLLLGGDGNDIIDGNQGNDTLKGGAGEDVLSGGDGADRLYGGTDNDRLFGGDGCDTLYGGSGDDVLSGGNGNDRMYGQDGDDTLILGGNGDDCADGGQGSDTFVVTAGDHWIVGGEDCDNSDIDVLDLSGAGPYQITEYGPESGLIEFLDEDGNVFGRTYYKEIEKIICFTPGTAIATLQGERAVEDLKVGDRVFTRDNGAQKIRWVGRKSVSLADGTLGQNLQPILIRKGALGHGLPERDMRMSPNHRVLMASKQAQLYFDETEVFVAAKHLVGMPGIQRDVVAQVDYVHFLCDQHEVVLSNSAWSETFQPGDYSMAGLGAEQRAEIYTLFPELKAHDKVTGYAAARRSLKAHEARLLIN